jgi:hypothetical protein
MILKMRLLVSICLTLIVSISIGQNIKRDSLSPVATELWEPKPAKVTPGAKPGDAPSDAIILFGGKDLSEWTSLDGSPAKWTVTDGIFTVVKGTKDIKTKKVFGDFQLHIEWRVPADVIGKGQDRGNSGIFLQERYEVQVLDNFENQTYSNGQAGSIYKQAIPLANPTRKQGEWQAYDIIYTAPRFSDNGRVIIPAYVTVLLNGVIVQNHTQIVGSTDYRGFPLYTAHGKAGIKLQDHDHAVSYRNIWLREL